MKSNDVIIMATSSTNRALKKRPRDNEDDSKPLCRFGEKCYLNSADHLKEFSHSERKKPTVLIVSLHYNFSVVIKRFAYEHIQKIKQIVNLKNDKILSRFLNEFKRSVQSICIHQTSNILDSVVDKGPAILTFLKLALCLKTMSFFIISTKTIAHLICIFLYILKAQLLRRGGN